MGESPKITLRTLRWSLLPSVLLSLGLGAAGMAFWFFVEEVDEDLCHIRSDGQGLIPLHNQFGPEVYCDPKWGMVGLGTLYYAVLLMPFVVTLVWTLRAGFQFSRRN